MPFFPEYDPSRRKLLIVAGGVAAATALSVSDGIGPSEIMNALKISYEYGPEVAEKLIRHPVKTVDQALEVYRLWKRPERTYERSVLLTQNLVYEKGTANNIVGVGDSNLVEPDGTQWRESPIKQYRKLAEAKYGFDHWEDVNFARSGYTTDEIIQYQVPSLRAENVFERGIRCDVWINAGGNDGAHLIQNEGEVDEITRLARDPFADLDLLSKYTDRIETVISEFEGRFLGLLHAISESSPNSRDAIRQFVVMSIPDFGKAKSIITQEFNGKPYFIDLKNSAVKRLVENVAVLTNNAMFRAAAKFQSESKDRVIGINTATPEISDFSSNQHFSPKACKEIAQVAAGRVSIIDP